MYIALDGQPTNDEKSGAMCKLQAAITSASTSAGQVMPNPSESI